jgi:hypothetical protein
MSNAVYCHHFKISKNSNFILITASKEISTTIINFINFIKLPPNSTAIITITFYHPKEKAYINKEKVHALFKARGQNENSPLNSTYMEDNPKFIEENKRYF